MRITLSRQGRKIWSGDVAPGSSQQVTLGSSRKCDVKVEGEGIAPLHAEFGIEPPVVWLCAHAPLIADGSAVVGWIDIAHGTVLQLGKQEVEVGIVADAPAKPAKPPKPAKAQPAAPVTPPPVAEPSGSVSGVAIPHAAMGPGNLGQIFSLPAPEVAADPGKVKASPFKRRILGLETKTWIMASLSAAIGAVVLTTRQVPMAAADGRSLVPTVEVLPSRPLSAAERPKPGKPRVISRAEVEAAAAAALSGDMTTALKRYRALADADSRYTGFKRALENRLKNECDREGSDKGSNCP
ncbi:MAG TPA: FHA domain-containing protein [Polyangia bacterium]